MKTNPSSIAVTASLFFDSFDYIVLFLVVSAGIFFLWKRLRAIHFPLVFSGLLTLGLWKAIPAWAVPGNIDFFCILWVPAIFISLVSYIIENRKKNPKIVWILTCLIIFLVNYYIYSRSGNVDFFVRGNICVASIFVIYLENYKIASRKEKQKDLYSLGSLNVKILTYFIFCLINYYINYRACKVDFFVINNYSLAVILFLGISMLQPARFLPTVVFKETSKFCLYLALGVFLLRGSFWTYTAFNAAITEPPGSFLPRGVIFAKEWSEVWQFQHLEKLIDKYWLYKKVVVQPEADKESGGEETVEK